MKTNGNDTKSKRNHLKNNGNAVESNGNRLKSIGNSIKSYGNRLESIRRRLPSQPPPPQLPPPHPPTHPPAPWRYRCRHCLCEKQIGWVHHASTMRKPCTSGPSRIVSNIQSNGNVLKTIRQPLKVTSNTQSNTIINPLNTKGDL